MKGFSKSAQLDSQWVCGGNVGVRVTGDDFVESSPRILEIEECVGDVRDALEGNIFHLKVAGIVGPVCMIHDALLARHFFSLRKRGNGVAVWKTEEV
jgi:hypothetical protein